jgi:protein SCO1
MTRRLVSLLLLGAGSGLAQTPHDHMHHAVEPAREEALKPSIPDLALLNQDGEKVRFYSDLVKGKVVAINFIFTTCTTICPPMGATFAKVQSLLGQRMGTGLQLISISIDPANDTPQRLKAWGDKFHRQPGWTFVTGPKPEIDALLASLGASVSGKAEHTPVVVIGNDATGAWTRAYGLGGATQVAKIIDAMATGRKMAQ